MIDTREKRAVLLHSLFTTALDGGIGYWAEVDQYRWATDEDGRTEDLAGFRAVIVPPESDSCWGALNGDDDGQPLTIDREVMERGLDRWLEWMTTDARDQVGAPVDPASTWPWRRQPWRPDNEYWARFADDVTQQRWDAADFDAGIADAVVQLGLFDETVFG